MLRHSSPRIQGNFFAPDDHQLRKAGDNLSVTNRTWSADSRLLTTREISELKPVLPSAMKSLSRAVRIQHGKHRFSPTASAWP